MNITEILFDNYIYVLGIIVLIGLIYIISALKSDDEIDVSQTNSDECNDKDYEKSLLSSLPNEDRAEMSELYSKLEYLKKTIKINEASIEQQKKDAIDSIQTEISKSKKHISREWANYKQKKDFSRCIGLHYASFQLADAIKKEQEIIKQSYNSLDNYCKKLEKEILALNKQIPQKTGSAKYELKKKHKDICRKHQRCSKFKNLFYKENKEFIKMVKKQNKETAIYKNYIINNFGIRGKEWGEKLKTRKNKQ